MIAKVLVSTALIALAFMLLSKDSGRKIAIRRLIFAMFLFLSMLSLFFQGAWTSFSNWLGFSSGADLITYLIAIGFFGYVITNFRWKRRMEDKIVEIVREIALKDKP